jgi:hypothetical protein
MNGRSCIENAKISVRGEPRHVDRTGIIGTHCHQSGLIRLFDSHQERGAFACGVAMPVPVMLVTAETWEARVCGLLWGWHL